MIIREISQGIGPQDGTLCLLGIWDTVLAEGEGFRPHAHDGIEEAYYIVEGTGEMFLSGEAREVKAGDIVYIPPKSIHFIRSRGRQPLRVITVSVDVGRGSEVQPGYYRIEIRKN
jgi:mannose-6-phosphate isomerase-like protein (cupin superfamily)